MNDSDSAYVRDGFLRVADQQERLAVEMLRPFYTLKPRIEKFQGEWACIYGESMASGIVGVGKTPEEASRDFDHSWRNQAAKPVPRQPW